MVFNDRAGLGHQRHIASIAMSHRFRWLSLHFRFCFVVRAALLVTLKIRERQALNQSNNSCCGNLLVASNLLEAHSSSL